MLEKTLTITISYTNPSNLIQKESLKDKDRGVDLFLKDEFKNFFMLLLKNKENDYSDLDLNNYISITRKRLNDMCGFCENDGNSYEADEYSCVLDSKIIENNDFSTSLDDLNTYFNEDKKFFKTEFCNYFEINDNRFDVSIQIE